MSWKTEAIKHAEECMPQESCGLLAIIEGKETYWPCKNLAYSGFDYFIIDPDDWVECEDTGEIISIVHSHVYDPPQPSDKDKASCEYLDLPFYIYSITMKKWCFFEPSGWKAPSLIGRSFVWGVYDCWSLITDWFLENKNIKIDYTKRPTTLKQFIKNPLFEKTLPKLGFTKQLSNDNLLVGDVLLFQSITGNLDHVAVYIGNNMILNHNIRRLSCREPFNLNFQQALRGVYRYET